MNRMGRLTLLLLAAILLLGLSGLPVQAATQDDNIVITAPLAGETLNGGSEYEIKWEIPPGPFSYSVLLQYSLDGGLTWADISNISEENPTSYSWTVPNVSSSSAIVRVNASITSGFPPYGTEILYNDSGTFAVKKSSLIIPLNPNLPLLELLPKAPTNLKAVALSASKVELTWEDNSNNETEFLLERLNPGASWKGLTKLDEDTTSYTDTGLTSNSEYSYRIKAANNTGYSEYAGPVEVTTPKLTVLPVEPVDPVLPIDPDLFVPLAPSDLEADKIASDKVELNWEDNSDIESGFKLERAKGSGSYSQIASLGAGIEDYTDNSVESGKNYSYRVMAYNNVGNSKYSNTLSVSTPAVDEKENEEGETNTDTPDTSVSLHFTIGSKSYKWNNATQNIDVAPIIRESRTLLPIRYVADPLGAQVLWNATEGKVTVKTDTKTIELWINNNTAKVNGTDARIDTANTNVTPIIIPPGRMMLPLRFIADNLDCDVVWSAANQSIVVTYPK